MRTKWWANSKKRNKKIGGFIENWWVYFSKGFNRLCQLLLFLFFFFNLISVLLVLPAMPDCIVFLSLSLLFLSSLLTEMFAHNLSTIDLFYYFICIFFACKKERKCLHNFKHAKSKDKYVAC